MTGLDERVDIVLPCLDEAGALPWILDRMPAGARALVVDNGSSDGSPDIARDHGATVITCRTRGYGAACHAGLEAAEAPFVAFCDCDGSLDPGDVGALLAAARGTRDGDHADLVVGHRRPVSRGAWPLSSRIANYELARRIRRRTGIRINDVGPFRLARREALLTLPVGDRRSGYPVEQVVRAADAGWRIVQVDVGYHPRIGRSKVTGTLRGTLTAVRDMSAVLAA